MSGLEPAQNVWALILQGLDLDVVGTREEEMHTKMVTRVECNKGEVCTFKPRCKFHHPEGGNVVPERKKSQRKKSVKTIEEALEQLSFHEEQ